MIYFGSRRLESILSLSRKKLDFSFVPFDSRILAVSTFASLRREFDYSCLLESSTGEERLAELSVIVFDPTYVLTSSRGKVKLEDRRNQTGTVFDEIDPLRAVQKIIQLNPSKQTELRFMGGAVGYISYDAIRYWEKLRVRSKEKRLALFPDMQFGIYEEGVILDHRRGKSYYFASNRVRERSKEIREICNRKDDSPEQSSQNSFSFSRPKANVTQERFEYSVRRAKEHIRNGDIFQVVLSKRFEFNLKGDLMKFYSNLRKINPSPYMYFFDFGSTKIVGSSPEMLARVERGVIETFPIAGTRPHVEDGAENERLRSDLLSDPKERAEHVMLVDLARNDVGRVSEFGSVSVSEFMQVHQFSHVQHIVSHVTGRLRDGLTSFDAMRSIFPAGTVSGAPKIRAMEIIDQLEPDARGPYAGAVGYFSFNGNMDSAITIRTLVASGEKASIQAGAGIVADSDPEREWKETEGKAAALIRTLGVSAGNFERVGSSK